MELLHIVEFVVSIGLLWIGAEWIVDSAAAVARRFDVPDLVIGLTIVAFGTSAPEFLVTLTAAMRGMSDISLSNIVGSNIFNLGIILGLMAMIKPIRSGKVFLYRDGLALWAVTIIILIMAHFGTLGRLNGVLLVGALLGYIVFILVHGRKQPIPVDEIEHRTATWKDLPKLLAGFAAIAAGGHFMVDAAKAIALALGVSEWVVGVTIVAAGTSLPELVSCLAMTMKGRNDMMLGNLIGSDFFNFAGVLGLTCLLRPLTVSPEAMSNLWVLIGMIALVLVFIRTGWRLSRFEGMLLVSINAGRWVWDLS